MLLLDRIALRAYLYRTFGKVCRIRTVIFCFTGILIYLFGFRVESAMMSIWLLGLAIDYWQAMDFFPRRVERPGENLFRRPVQDLGDLRKETCVSATGNWVGCAIAWAGSWNTMSGRLFWLPLIFSIIARALCNLAEYSTDRKNRFAGPWLSIYTPVLKTKVIS